MWSDKWHLMLFRLSRTLLRLLKPYFCSYYECELWDLSCKAIDDFCIMWPRVLNLCGATERHSFLLPRYVLRFELWMSCACAVVTLFYACLSSVCSLISFVARQGIFYSLMALPLGRNVHFCCTRYGRLPDNSFIRNNYINYKVTSNLPKYILQTACILCELYFFLHDGSFTFTSSCLSLEDINYLISNVCRDQVLWR